MTQKFKIGRIVATTKAVTDPCSGSVIKAGTVVQIKDYTEWDKEYWVESKDGNEWWIKEKYLKTSTPAEKKKFRK